MAPENWGTRMSCEGPSGNMLGHELSLCCREASLQLPESGEHTFPCCLVSPWLEAAWLRGTCSCARKKRDPGEWEQFP